VSVWRRFEQINPTGVIGTPSQASAEAGARLFAAAVDAGRDTIRRIKDRYGARTAP